MSWDLSVRFCTNVYKYVYKYLCHIYLYTFLYSMYFRRYLAAHKCIIQLGVWEECLRRKINSFQEPRCLELWWRSYLTAYQLSSCLQVLLSTIFCRAEKVSGSNFKALHGLCTHAPAAGKESRKGVPQDDHDSHRALHLRHRAECDPPASTQRNLHVWILWSPIGERSQSFDAQETWTLHAGMPRQPWRRAHPSFEWRAWFDRLRFVQQSPGLCQRRHASQSGGDLRPRKRASCWYGDSEKGAASREDGTGPCQHSWPCTCWLQCVQLPLLRMRPALFRSCSNESQAMLDGDRITVKELGLLSGARRRRPGELYIVCASKAQKRAGSDHSNGARMILELVKNTKLGGEGWTT